MKKIHIFGDSHVNILYMGWQSIAERWRSLPFQIEFYARNGANWFEFDIIETDGRLRFYGDRFDPALDVSPVDYSTGCLDDIYIFSSPLHSCTVYRDSTWHEFCPWECATSNPELQAVSTSVIEAWSEAQIACRLSMLRMMKAQGYNVAVVEPPKPLNRTPALYALRRDVLATADRTYRNFIVEQLRAIGVSVISAPENTYVEGFTTDEFSAFSETDPHHGNEKYGAEMMTKILQLSV